MSVFFMGRRLKAGGRFEAVALTGLLAMFACGHALAQPSAEERTGKTEATAAQNAYTSRREKVRTHREQRPSSTAAPAEDIFSASPAGPSRPQKKTIAKHASASKDKRLKVYIPNPDAVRQETSPATIASITVLDRQLAPETDESADNASSASIEPSDRRASRKPQPRTPAMPMSASSGDRMPVFSHGTIAVPDADHATEGGIVGGSVTVRPQASSLARNFINTVSAPLSATLSAVSSILDQTHIVIAATSQRWVKDSQNPPPAPVLAAPLPAPEAPAIAAFAPDAAPAAAVSEATLSPVSATEPMLMPVSAPAPAAPLTAPADMAALAPAAAPPAPASTPIATAAAPPAALPPAPTAAPPAYAPALPVAVQDPSYVPDPAAAVFADNQPLIIYYPPQAYPPAAYPPAPYPYPPMAYPYPYPYPPTAYPPMPYPYPPAAYAPPAPYPHPPQAYPPAAHAAAPAPAAPPSLPPARSVAEISVTSAAPPPAPPMPPSPSRKKAPPPVAASLAPVIVVQRSAIDLTKPVPPSHGTEVYSQYGQLAPAAGTETPATVPAPGTPAAPAAIPVSAVMDGMAPVPAVATAPPTTAASSPAPAIPASPLPTPLLEPAPAPVTDGTEPQPSLTGTTRKTLSKIPSGLDAASQNNGSPIVLDRQKAQVPPEGDKKPDAEKKPEDAAKKPEGAGKKDEAPAAAEPANPLGIKVGVGTPGFDAQYELERAYNALVAGDNETAIRFYQNVLANESGNKQALFGLGATYHRAGQIDKARPYYSRLLKLDPTHREALNNFLALAADEAPQEALGELAALEERNPDFSPIPAQLAYLHQKLGQTDQAIEKMVRAVSLSPENLTYRYNLAVLFDKAGRRQEAFALYKQLVDAHTRGDTVPGDIGRIQQRLTFLGSNRP